ncbi:MAG: DUF1919 domain-containing protein [Selenomonadaceae bacterium]|nr:DUF1919 domain-containing protein [Selenomonadaceae bacterium]
MTIFANLCWAGFAYHDYGLPFLSPFIDMFVRDDDYIKFLQSPEKYIKAKPTFKKMIPDPGIPSIEYPILTLKDIELHMEHYKTPAEAIKKWNDRKKRINWYDLLVMMYTEREDILDKFDQLPYGKKICFVPFKTNKPSAFYLPPEIVRGRRFSDAVNDTARGPYEIYDLLDILLYGKNTILK